MRCPVCNMEMKMAERQGIEIDYCPQCRGIWLDRGELDKIIERAVGIGGTSATSPVPPTEDRTISLDKPKPGHAPATAGGTIQFEDDYRQRVLRQRHADRKGYRHDDDDHDDGDSKSRRDSRKKKENSISDFFGDLFDF